MYSCVDISTDVDIRMNLKGFGSWGFLLFWGETVNALKSFVIRLTFVSEMNIHVYAVPASQEQFPNNVAVVSTLGGTVSVNAKLHYPFLQSYCIDLKD